MPHDLPLKSPAQALSPREIPHTVSPGLWTLAWRRLKSDYVGMVSLAIVGVFLVMMLLSATGLIARDWSREVGTNYAPPSFIGADVEGGTPAAPAAPAEAPPPASEYRSQIVDPIGDVIAELKGEKVPAPASAVPGAASAEKLLRTRGGIEATTMRVVKVFPRDSARDL